ncbi:MAG: hypothetical protein U1D96_10040 [Eubacteriales bacterium]|jgi:uncharacterized membrane protein YkvI|nr:hypothetical protein [Bacillota bacterium]MBV1727123.1 hypothetical protein [Desulforudis sp.]MDZ4043802.1 hypothetical protein [Eubacteriales bacterium]MBU4532306.1 hypothetical protein [Bacillota bacterium]MBU4554173.1 hypothetical protein [Bacillota bacterium]
MKNNGVGAYQIAATYIGVIIGAGFASGQEVLQFFVLFGLNGLYAVIAATVLFIFFGIVILGLGHQLQAKSHLEIIRHTGGPVLGGVIDAIITFFLFGTVTVMAAGAGAVFAQQFGQPPLLGSAFMIVITIGTVLLGIQGIVRALSLVVPLLVVAVLGVSLATIVTRPPSLGLMELTAVQGAAAVPYWPLSAVTYASYNLVIAIAIMGPLGALARDEKAIRNGSIFGSVVLGTGALVITLAILASPAAVFVDIPMAFIAGQFGPLVQFLYSFVLLIAIYSTAVANLYGFCARLTNPASPAFRGAAIGTSIIALIASQFGFTTLVGILYPGVGLAGFLLLGALVYAYFRRPLLRIR